MRSRRFFLPIPFFCRRALLVLFSSYRLFRLGELGLELLLAQGEHLCRGHRGCGVNK